MKLFTAFLGAEIILKNHYFAQLAFPKVIFPRVSNLYLREKD